MQLQNDYFAAYHNLKNKIVILTGAGGDFITDVDWSSFGDVAVAPGDGIFTTWSYRAGAGRAEAFLLNPYPLTARTAHEWGVVSEVVPLRTVARRSVGSRPRQINASKE